MKKSFISVAITASSLLFISCLEEEAIPVPLPPPPPGATEAIDLPPPPDTLAESPATPDTAIAPPAVPAPATEPEKPAAVPAAPVVKELPSPPISATSDIGQLNSGRYTIQVDVHKTEKGAKNVVRKLAENKISAYYVRVDNPAYLEGSFYRVRVGYFNGKSVAEDFARTRLTPLNYKWWVDMTRNDAVGTPTTYTPEQAPKKEAEKAPAATAPATSSKSSTQSTQEDEAKKAALEAAKADYKAFAEKADKESKAKAPPPPPVPKTAEKAASKSVEVSGGQVKIK